MQHPAGGLSMSLSVQFGALRTRELRELLEDEDKINEFIRSSEKFQELQMSADKMLLSNQKNAKIGLSQKPKFRDAKLLLAMKYKELGNLRSIIQAKQEQLAEKHSVHSAQWILLKKVTHAEEESEMLFQRFAEGKTPLAVFLDSFLSSRKLHHIRMVLVKRVQEVHDFDSTQRLSDTQQISDTWLPVCGLTTAVVLPACCHPSFLPPCDAHRVSRCHCLQQLPLCHDYNDFLRPEVHKRGLRLPARPVRLQPLKVQQRRHQQAPQ